MAFGLPMSPFESNRGRVEADRLLEFSTASAIGSSPQTHTTISTDRAMMVLDESRNISLLRIPSRRRRRLAWPRQEGRAR